ncbi:MAG: deoxyuridine 5'-triphosphate nucleotidohydrolase [Oscillospiraceae bacterium]|nr:deoxyuridine 5'-triphosphate nucleotidohydrolase [Oscillospiraceae bacterium]
MPGGENDLRQKNRCRYDAGGSSESGLSGADVYMPYDCTLQPGEIAKIPLGFGIEVPDGYAGYVFPRTSMAVKGLVCELPPVDSGYRGEIHAIISNVSSKPQELSEGFRVGQLVITPVVIADFVSELGELRGTGGFGSTGK